MGLSVIVPVYNGEKYIKDCLESIINQTYRDLQIIVVNDGSIDNTEAIVGEIANKDSRVQLINKENGGVSSARNIGLDYVNKDCITFVDDDDTLDLDMYEMLMNYINRGYDIAHCGYKRISKEGIKLVNGTGNITIQNSNDALRCLITGKLFVGSLCNKVFKGNLFKDIKFDESIKINEDILVNYEVFKKSNKSVFIDEAKYNYFEREESTCKNTNRVRTSEDCLKVAKLIRDNSKNSELEKVALEKYIRALIGLYRSYYYNKVPTRGQNLKTIRKEIKLNYKNNCIMGRKEKISSALIIYMPFVYGLLYKIYDRIRVPNWDV